MKGSPAEVEEFAEARKAELARPVTITVGELKQLAGADDDDILEGALLHAADTFEVIVDAVLAECGGAEALARVAMAAERRARTTVEIVHQLRRADGAKAEPEAQPQN